MPTAEPHRSPGRAGAARPAPRIVPDFVRGRHDAPARLQPRPSGRPRTPAAPKGRYRSDSIPERPFYETIFTRMITDDRKGSFRLERIAKGRKGRVEPGPARRSRQCGPPGRVWRNRPAPGSRTEDGANRVHEVVAHGERRALPASHDLGRQTRGAALITVLEEPGAKLVGGRRIEQGPRPRSVRFLPSAYSAGRPAGT